MHTFHTDKNENTEYIYVGNTSPLWCCKYTLKPNNSCVYCLCNDCYGLKDTSTGKRKRKNVHADKCDHEGLEPFNDSNYFTPSYLQNCLARNSYTPSKCSKCLKLLTSVKQFVCL